jgi:hypothetical protein
MTRLDSAIRRLQAQRAVLDWASHAVAGRPGVVLELGLGNGRTYDHLRARLPDRSIYAFERSPAAHPACMPDPDHLVVGDAVDTLPAFGRRFGAGCAALVHADIGSGDDEQNSRLVQLLSPLVAPLVAPGGVVVADRPFDLPGFQDVSGETGIKPGRYYAFRCPGRPLGDR